MKDGFHKNDVLVLAVALAAVIFFVEIIDLVNLVLRILLNLILVWIVILKCCLMLI